MYVDLLGYIEKNQIKSKYICNANGRNLNGQLTCFFIIKGFRTIVFVVIVISTTFRPIRPPALLKCLSNL